MDEDRQLPLPRRTDGAADHHGMKIKLKLAPRNLEEKDLEEKELRQNGGAVAELEEKQQQLRVCDFCGKGFESGKALGGHRRIHLIDKDRIQKNPKKARKVVADEPDRDSQQTCFLCGKTFRSEKSLFGHMRFHPERSWRGIKPPPSAAAAAVGNIHSSCSTVTDEVDEPDQEESGACPEPVDLIGSLSGWTRTDRRGKRSTYQEPSDEDDQTDDSDDDNDGAVPDDAAAQSLMYLSQGAKGRKVKIECGEEHDVSGALPLKKRRIDGDVEEEEVKPKERFRCGTCNKTFSKFQALGGHRSSHAKNVAGESTSSDQRNRCEENGQEHRCKICDKSFLTGQALGGHQRCHWSGPAVPEAGERETTTSGFGRNLMIDLNELPPEEEEEGGSGGAESAFNPGTNQY